MAKVDLQKVGLFVCLLSRLVSAFSLVTPTMMIYGVELERYLLNGMIIESFLNLQCPYTVCVTIPSPTIMRNSE